MANTEDLTSNVVSNLSKGSCFIDTDYIREKCSSLLATVKETGTLNKIALTLLNTVCGYLFHPTEGFIALKGQTVSLRAFYDEMVGLSKHIPGDMRPKLEDIENYLAESKTLVDTMTEEIFELLKVSVLLFYGLKKDLCLATKV